MRSGALLDMAGRMKPVSCAIYAFPEAEGRGVEPARMRKISADPNFYPRHVLVVDDEPLIRWSVTESLVEAGLDVEQAGDAASALRVISTTALPFDVVILDLRLPDMHDLSLLGTVRQLLPSATVILMTAFGTPDVIAEAESLGASVLLKPFELEALTRLIGLP
jgi:DNA-binding NtrC family response regulator